MEAFVEAGDNFMKSHEEKQMELRKKHWKGGTLDLERRTCFGIGVFEAKLDSPMKQYTLLGCAYGSPNISSTKDGGINRDVNGRIW